MVVIFNAGEAVRKDTTVQVGSGYIAYSEQGPALADPILFYSHVSSGTVSSTKLSARRATYVRFLSRFATDRNG